MWKVECDALTPEDWAALAYMAMDKFDLKFGRVVGIPRGGKPFAKALKGYTTDGCSDVLLVDDVYTTGSSWRKFVGMWDYFEESDFLVAFARGQMPEHEGWHALWKM